MPNITGMDLLKIAAANPDATVPPEGLELLNGKQAKRNKFGEVRVTFDDMKFDSKAEMARYSVLRYMELMGEISQLDVHPVFQLHAKVKYVADFRYVEQGKTIVEDVKGVETAVFRVKWKQVRELYPDIDFRIVRK